MPELVHKETGRKVSVAQSLVDYYFGLGWEAVDDAADNDAGSDRTATRPTTKRRGKTAD